MCRGSMTAAPPVRPFVPRSKATMTDQSVQQLGDRSRGPLSGVRHRIRIQIPDPTKTRQTSPLGAHRNRHTPDRSPPRHTRSNVQNLKGK